MQDVLFCSKKGINAIEIFKEKAKDIEGSVNGPATSTDILCTHV